MDHKQTETYTMETTEQVDATSTQVEVEQDETKSTERSFKVSFDSIDPTSLQYSLSYKCAKSATGQVVQGLNHLRMYVLGEGEYEGNKKVATNPFQTSLYPNIASLAKTVVEEYKARFVDGVTDPLQLQVFGANLNGSRNDGQLNKFITCKGVNRFLRYQYSQLGQLLMLLHYRLAFVANRDPQSVKRYQENAEECKHFEDLRSRAKEFCEYLKTTTLVQWATHVTEARKFNEENGGTVKPVKLTADNVERKSYQTEKPAQHPRHPRTYNNTRHYRSTETTTEERGSSSGRWNTVSSGGPYRTNGFRGRGRGRGGYRGRGGGQPRQQYTYHGRMRVAVTSEPAQ